MAKHAPDHLSNEMKAFWRDVMSGWSLDEHHIKLLTQACTAHDRAHQARRSIEEDGLVIPGTRGQLVENPAVRVERAAQAEFRQSLRALNLDDSPDPTKPPTRPKNSAAS